MDRVGNGYRLCMLGYLNGWIRDRAKAGVTGAFGVPGKNDNGRRPVEFCAERGLYVGNTIKYTRVTRDQDGVEGTTTA